MGLDGRRVYLDWNATAPLRPEARAAMLDVMDVVGNPASVHAEGRVAKAMVEKARGQVARLVGCAPDEVVFTSGATEAARTVFQFDHLRDTFLCAGIEHDCVIENARLGHPSGASVTTEGRVRLSWPTMRMIVDDEGSKNALVVLAAANGEIGVTQFTELADLSGFSENDERIAVFSDVAQAAGKTHFAWSDYWIDFAALSAHKLGGPKGCGALIVGQGIALNPLLGGGGQEQGRRSGTENVIGIAGFGAAAEAARRDLEDGVWERVEKLRDDLEDAVASAAPDLHIFGKDAPRLPNTSCFAVPGWKGETQVMQMDLSGFAVSAGSACSSGKVNKASRVLLAMGFDEVTASSAIRVSMGPTTTEAEVMAFADAWIEHYRRRRERAA
jgi:cysteine desulfurase